MTRPSRLARWSAQTTRQTGFLRLPMRVRRSLTDISAGEVSVPSDTTPRSSGLTHQRAQVGHASLGYLAHHLAHLLELLDQLLDGLDVGARAACDPQPPGALDQLGMAPLLGRHRQDDRLNAVELALIDLGAAQLLAHPGDH